MRNIPFGIPIRKDNYVRRREEPARESALYERNLAEYRNTLENYKKCITDYSSKLDSFEKRSLENQLSIVQSALDMTYLKEQGDHLANLMDEMKNEQMNKTLANLEHLITTVLDTNYKMDGLDKNVVNRLSELLFELQKQTFNQNKDFHYEMEQNLDTLNDKVRKNNLLLWFLFAFNLISLGGLIFVILYILEIIPFG